MYKDQLKEKNEKIIEKDYIELVELKVKRIPLCEKGKEV